MKEAAKKDIPFIGDVQLHPFETPSLVFWHYDYGQDLSPAELDVFETLLGVCSRRYDVTLRKVKTLFYRLGCH